MATRCWLLIVCLLWLFEADTVQSQWVQTNGPNEDMVYSLAASDSNLFAGIWCSGVLLSTDSVASWTAVNTGLTNTRVSSLCRD
jgi:hypothetical protein